MLTRTRLVAGISRWFATLGALTLWALLSSPASAQDGPQQEVFIPESGKGPAVVVISGRTGPPNYRNYTKQVAALGYYTVLIDGKDILTRAQDGAQNLRTVIAKAQASPHGMPDKVMVIGFSQGGGGILAHAVKMPDLIKAAVAHYPATSWARNLPAIVSRIQIPVLVLTGERDTYNNCCLIESMRVMESSAKEKQLPLELVVYPDAEHGFNLDGRYYRADDSADAWRRTSERLARHHPVK
ncbi:MAG: dienelactone hydrolase family protein [Burkholderiales bacterium]